MKEYLVMLFIDGVLLLEWWTRGVFVSVCCISNVVVESARITHHVVTFIYQRDSLMPVNKCWKENRPILSVVSICRVTVLSGSVRFMRIFVGVPWKWASDERLVVKDSDFFCTFGSHIFLEPLEIELTLLNSDMNWLTGFPVTLQCLTLKKAFHWVYSLFIVLLPVCCISNVLVESARIARGNIKPLSQLSAGQFDAVVFPGGFGAAKNLYVTPFLSTVNKQCN